MPQGKWETAFTAGVLESPAKTTIPLGGNSMLAKPKNLFHEFTNLWEMAKKGMPDATDQQMLMNLVRMMKETGKQPSEWDVYDFTFSKFWTEHGKPTFKVCDSMCERLCETAIPIPRADVTLPYHCFIILTPLKWLDPQWVMVTNALSPKDEKKHLLVSWWEGDGSINHYRLDNTPDKTIEDDLSSQTLNDGIERESTDRAVRLGIGVALLATNNHPLITPELTHKRIEKLNRKTDAEREKWLGEYQNKDAKWFVGADVQLSLEDERRIAEGSRDGKPLSKSHLRRGHMRHQHYGKGNAQKKLIFILPTVVRRDLQERKEATYTMS